VKNPFNKQPLKFRLEVLMSAGSYDDANNIVLVDFSSPDQFSEPPRTADGVTASLDETSNSPEQAGIFRATNSGKVPCNAAWARLDRTFGPHLNLKKHQAISLWLEGDGLGEIIALRLESPRHISYGAVADRYITVDFTGRRFVTLVETESTRWSDYVWNDGKGLYNVYRESINFGTVKSLSIWYNNLPEDKQVRCKIGPIKAIPMMACEVKNPSIVVNGKDIVLPVTMSSGSYLELDAEKDCILYGSKGEVISHVTPNGEVPVLSTGVNDVRISCDSVDGPAPRLKLTIISHGEPF
jgi:hypothetical protein